MVSRIGAIGHACSTDGWSVSRRCATQTLSSSSGALDLRPLPLRRRRTTHVPRNINTSVELYVIAEVQDDARELSH
ncbi:hypothetical protein LshimejAT787_0704330 [Lyophyllum shimeji]|uniref:Uncharacterized protein n=1 Tax=Lyophyllum shimeji TaxID=47721 RepID=A0A9P3UNQ7_LYOSH|nr:hypothetical protein LshimejAT787_0704330 [Lyophyllum shimeji]